MHVKRLAADNVLGEWWGPYNRRALIIVEKSAGRRSSLYVRLELVFCLCVRLELVLSFYVRIELVLSLYVRLELMLSMCV